MPPKGSKQAKNKGKGINLLFSSSILISFATVLVAEATNVAEVAVVSVLPPTNHIFHY